MKLIAYNPVNAPKANVVKSEEGYVIELAVPGFSKSDVEIALENGVLKVAGKPGSEAEKQYTRREFVLPAFERRFVMPDGIVSESIEARCENGILRIMLPEKKPVSHRVEVA